VRGRCWLGQTACCTGSDRLSALREEVILLHAALMLLITKIIFFFCFAHRALPNAMGIPIPAESAPALGGATACPVHEAAG
jgi:hypothetical protein